MRLPDPRRSRAVLIGTSRYQDPEIPDLPAVRRTVDDLAALLTDPDHGIFAEEHCTVVRDETDLRTIGRRLRSALNEAEDLLLVYYAGHGLVAGRRHDLYLSLPDSEWEAPEFSSLEYDKLRTAVLDSPAAAKLVVLDCCFSGRVITDSMDGDGTRLNQLDVGGTYVLTSAERDQVALVVPGEDHTAFTGRLMRLLREGVADGPELLTVDALYRQLSVLMEAEGLSVPLSRVSRTASDIALGTNRAFAAHARPRLTARRQAAVDRGRTGDWSHAARELESVLAEQLRIFGPDDPDTLLARQSHAHARGGAGDPDAAAEDLRSLAEDHARLLGPDHPDTLRTRQFLAVNLGEAGYREEAITRLRVLAADRTRVLGAQAPATMRTWHLLAHNLTAAGLRDEAAAILRQLLPERERLLGRNHPHTVRARADLAALTQADAPGRAPRASA